MKKIALFALLLFLPLVSAKAVQIDYYYQIGCPHCVEFEKTLEEVKAEGKYSLNVTSYELRYNISNRPVFQGIIDKFNISADEQGTPTVVLDNNAYFVGAISKQEFEGKLDKCLAGDCGGGKGRDGNRVLLTPLTAFVAGFVSGFNPCLFAVLLFLISYSLAMSENKMRLVKLTVSFSLGIFAAYFLIGWGLLSFAGVIDLKLLSLIISIIVIILGLWTLKDYKNPKSLLVETPDSIKGMSESLTRKNSALTAFLLGGLFSLVKAPCVGGIYISILSMASAADINMQLNALPLLASYNLGLIFPLLLISGAVLFGVSPKTIEDWREQNKYGMRIFLGLTLILLGLFMLWQDGIIRF
jgi:cytochrome c biogenesis protein CcdA